MATLTVGSIVYTLDGPHLTEQNLKNLSGLYVITTTAQGQSDHLILDIGESGAVRDRVNTHDRLEQWKARNRGSLHVAAYYCDEATRTSLERLWRTTFNPPCGVR